ncbi:MAG: hypothetical protein ACO1N9_02935 [Flavobacterium sp.]
MEYNITHTAELNANNALSYTKAAAQFEDEARVPQELSCNHYLKNLIKTNLRLLKLNELSAIVLL